MPLIGAFFIDGAWKVYFPKQQQEKMLRAKPSI
jgi:hypothetical protein